MRSTILLLGATAHALTVKNSGLLNVQQGPASCKAPDSVPDHVENAACDGTTCNPTCKEGYHKDGLQANCQGMRGPNIPGMDLPRNGWVISGKCSENVCAAITDDPPNIDVSGCPGGKGKACHAVCEAGWHNAEKGGGEPLEVICKGHNQEWELEDGCAPDRCGPPSDNIDNVEVDKCPGSGPPMAGLTCELSCKQGFHQDPALRHSCPADEKPVAVQGKCVADECTEPSEHNMNTSKCAGQGTKCELECNNGFHSDTPLKATCPSHGKTWDVAGGCSPDECIKPTANTANVDLSKCDKKSDKCSVSCGSGYHEDPSLSTSCPKDGSPWDIKGSCKKDVCNKPDTNVDNVDLAKCGTGETCELKCNKGFFQSNPLGASCPGHNKDWDVSGKCLPDVCTKPDSNTDNVNLSKCNGGEACEVSCAKGFHSDGALETSCAENNAVWQIKGKCVADVCKAPQDFDTVNVNVEKCGEGDTCEVKCDEGFHAVMQTNFADLQTSCPAHGEHWKIDGKCEADVCTKPNGNTNNMDLARCQRGTTCSVECDKGFHSDKADDKGELPTKCARHNAAWEVEGKCVVDECESPTGAPDSWNLSNCLGKSSTCGVTCGPGFHGDLTTACPKHGDEWAVTGSCARNECSKPTVNTANTNIDGCPGGKDCFVKCEKGYHAVGDGLTTTCAKNGDEWVIEGECALNHCSTPTANTENVNLKNCQSGTTCDVKCKAGSRDTGMLEGVCPEHNGTWDLQGGQCVEEEPDFKGCPQQPRFDELVCYSYTCTECPLKWCTQTCQDWQERFPLCRCSYWPKSRTSFSAENFAGQGGFGDKGDYQQHRLPGSDP